ncbi:MAG TPA: methylated-DNA--[protein]-cysteine S-methyltransferase [Gemmatimonadales bacterium]|nr:methylated-DNA--[protein]-cysteine S-methyltransferase [Gemmatimonadales bacterium]
MISTPSVASARLPRDAELHRAVDERDPSYEGLFVVGIRTTGIFCRPTCPSKPSRRENRQFFARVDEATAAGYRPCRRCKPLEALGSHPSWVRSILALLDENPAAELGAPLLQRLGIHPAAARRYFLRSFGMTLQGYARARRLGLALDALQRGTPVLPAGFESGFGSDSGFRDAFKRVFGVTPTEARGLPPIVVTLIASPLGPLVAGATDSGLCMLEFADRKKLPQQAADLRRWFARPVVPGTNRFTDQAARELEEYFAGTRQEFGVPLVLGGTPFQETVWRELLRIPYGQTICYEELARRIGKPSAQRAVGMANGRNRIPIVVPCHRVIQKNGQLRGYGGGLWRKKFLLDLEKQ